MKSVALASLLTLGLTFGAPTVALSHVGHGDEFQATGGIDRVRVNPETDSMLGIIVEPIQPAEDGSFAVTVPVTAIVDADGKQLVFVQYENFYEPVEVTMGETRGELVEITEGLSVGEELVTQGSLSLYAESRKTQTAETETAEAPVEAVTAQEVALEETTETDEIVAVQPEEMAPESGGFPMGILAAIGGGAVLVVGGFAIANRSRQ